MFRTIKLTLSLLLIPFLVFFSTHYVTPSTPSAQQPVAFYSNQLGEDLRKVFTQAIDQANDSVFLVIYSLYDKPVINALNRAALLGKKVTVIADPEASKHTFRYLKKPINLTYRESFGLMHRKILITDHSHIWIGSANMTRASLRMHDNLVLGLENSKLARFLEKTSSETPIKTPAVFKFKNQTGEMWLFPEHEKGEERLISLIDSAKKTVRVAMFTFTHYKLCDALIRAHERGVDVKVAIDRESSNGFSKKIAKNLYRAQVPLRVNTTQHLLHHKFALIDNALASGSANWTHAAFTKNDDCLLILQPLQKKQVIYMNQLWKRIERESKPFKAKVY